MHVSAINLSGGTLTIEGERSARVELKADGKDQFSEVGPPIRLSFVRDSDGKVSGLSFSSGGRQAARGRWCGSAMSQHIRTTSASTRAVRR